LKIIKSKYDLIDESAAIDFIVAEYEEEMLEPELKPEFIKEMKEIMKEKPIDVGTIDDLRKRYGN